MLTVVAIALGLVVTFWASLALIARRLPAGILKDLVGFLPACATVVRRLRKDPRVPRSAKIAVALAGLWLLSPIDLVPEFLPVIGPLDDVIVIALALRYVGRRLPHDVVRDAWPGDARLLDKLLKPTSG